MTAVASNGFAGTGAAWFSTSALEEFAAALSAYPLGVPGPAIAGGFFSGGEPAILSQEHVGVAAYVVELRGQIGVQVRLATEVWESTRPESMKRTKPAMARRSRSSPLVSVQGGHRGPR